MRRELISDKQGIAIVALFLSGSTSVFVTGLEAEKDVWLAIILAMVMVLPMITIFARLHHIYPDENIFDIMEKCLGKYIGKIVMIVFTWYSFFWAADVLNNYGFFMKEVSLVETPTIVTIIMLAMLCIFCLKKGIEVLGRWSEFFIIISIISILISIVLISPKMNMNNIKPVMVKGIKPVLKGSISVFMQPFVQISAFTMVFSSFKTKKSSYRVYFIGLFIGGLLTLLIAVTNILVIGPKEALRTYYPSYVAVSRMNIGDFLQRLEVIIAMVFVLGGFVKISILILSTIKGLVKLLGLKDYRFIITPIILLIINLSYFQYDNVMHYFRFNSYIWSCYFFPFQIVLPVIIWIAAEIKELR
ncbi:GerAB/ArcD/ProY family transporter [Paramaledivibacter caminithermalis]|uniref:Spore germination protein KB n=1 Tax=Paramaledivibacter caminithermalis (strain DSM 15212 / CIP 107654 / DViRD3) TaxID=1121301 RepID=A0A1M6NKE8_PARC5|nr:endospore germination permease [Paramaledivibacter caminithermalis]SHJ96187.1 spore germination protein KB [Paramaledivibacter caminithermalis DSM 15212]